MASTIETAVQVANEEKVLAQNFLARVNELSITLPNHYVAASDWLRDIKTRTAKIEERRKSITQPLDEAKRQVMALFKPVTTVFEQAATLISEKRRTYEREQERIRAQEEARLREEARKERERQEAEALERAAKLEAEGDAEGARNIIESVPEEVPPVVLPPTMPPKTEGVTTREVWKFEVEAKSLVPDEYKIVDEQKVGAVVRAMKKNHGIPGIRAYAETIDVTRRG